jgi:hypothetical protein
MRTRITIAGLSIIGIALALAANAANPPKVRRVGAAATQPLTAETLTKQQFEQQLKRLPDSAVIESKGQRMTKAQMRALAAQKGQAQQAKAKAALAQANAAFEQRRLQLEQQHRAKLQADHAKALAEFRRRE